MSENNGIVKKCGNCHFLIDEKLDKVLFLREIFKGVCKMSGKKMNGSLIAGCFYWEPRDYKKWVRGDDE